MLQVKPWELSRGFINNRAIGLNTVAQNITSITAGDVANYSAMKKFDRITKIVLRLALIAKTILDLFK